MRERPISTLCRIETLVAYRTIGRYHDRDIIVVGEQPWYRSTGRNSGQPGRWFPFDGIRGVEGAQWFDKYRFCEGPLRDRDHPLHRLGTEENAAIATLLGGANIPELDSINYLGMDGVNELIKLKSFMLAKGTE